MTFKTGIYEHFEGERYLVFCTVLSMSRIGSLDDYERTMVVYCPFGDSQLVPRYVMPIIEFEEHVSIGGELVPRFRYVE